MMSAEMIWNDLMSAVTAGEIKKIKKLATQFDIETIYGGDYPDDYFDLILKILSDKDVQKSVEVYPFLLSISPDMDRLSRLQSDALIKTIESNIDQFEDNMLVHTAIDLVSRSYPKGAILKLLRTYSETNILDDDTYIEMALKIAVRKNKIDQADAIKFLESLNRKR